MNRTGITTTRGYSNNGILASTQLQYSVSAIVANTGVTANSEGRKIIKAGTPVTGSLTARGTAFTLAATADGKSNAIGVLLHDADVTKGNANTAVLVFGFVDITLVDSTVAAMYTSEVKTALKQITFVG